MSASNWLTTVRLIGSGAIAGISIANIVGGWFGVPHGDPAVGGALAGGLLTALILKTFPAA